MDEILQRIEKVTISEWTGDMYLSPSDVLGDQHTGVPGVLFCGEMETDDLYEAIMELTTGWTLAMLDDIGCSEYTRPQ